MAKKKKKKKKYQVTFRVVGELSFRSSLPPKRIHGLGFKEYMVYYNAIKVLEKEKQYKRYKALMNK
jgi:hypothetical protein